MSKRSIANTFSFLFQHGFELRNEEQSDKYREAYFRIPQFLLRVVEESEEAMEAVRGMSAFERLIDPDEIAECLYWAAANPVINGSVLHANLGQIER